MLNKKFSLIVLALSIFVLAGGIPSCTSPDSKQSDTTSKTDSMSATNDPHSFSNSAEARIEHLALDITANFEKQVISGTATYDIKTSEDAEEIIFDTKNLDINSVQLGNGDVAEYSLGDSSELLGRPLIVQITPETEKVSITYSTNPGAAALQWLDPELTAGGEMPFLYSQGQAILTRTWIPIQDSPGIRITYEADVKVPKGMLAVMSASNPREKDGEGTYSFTMDQPIPPYLMALAAGDLTFASISNRTGVYAEPASIEAAKYEFGNMDSMLVAAEELYGPYLWDRFDVLVLPPAFPFGGMENPRLTFATPTILAGDRSLTALIAHELAHSWSGNLVTNATWDDFWLNEGFTVYFERRIMEALYGVEYANMLAELGLQDLEEDIDELGANSEDTHLHLDLESRNPDEGMTSIAYEKGYFFLRTLEETVGRDTFDAFLKQYFEDHKWETVTTDEFVQYLKKHLIEPTNADIDVDRWIYGPGIPENVLEIDAVRFNQVDQTLNAFLSGDRSAENLNGEDWSTHEWLYFIRKIPRETELEKLQALDRTFELSQSGNSEIQAAWYELSIYSGYYKENIDRIEEFLTDVGRRKFLTPLYKALKKTGQLDKARSIYEEARPGYHSVSKNTLDELLNI